MKDFFRSLAMTLLAVLLAASAIGNFAAAAEPLGAKERAAQLLRRALQAEAAGKSDDRKALLSEALSLDPDNVQARWHTGQIAVADKWYACGTTAAQGDDEKLAEYRARRAKCKLTSLAHKQLAAWCAENGLETLAQANLSVALAITRNGAERRALARGLKLVYYGGRFVSIAEAAQRSEAEAGIAERTGIWNERLQGIQWQIAGGNVPQIALALERVREIHDVAAVPALVSFFDAFSAPQFNANTFEIRYRIRGAALNALASIDHQQATEAIVYLAVNCQNATARAEAAQKLTSRSYYGYVPTLLAAFQAPVKAKLVTSVEGGQFERHLVYYQEGPEQDQCVIFEGQVPVWGSADVSYSIRGVPDTNHPYVHLINSPSWERVRPEQDVIVASAAGVENFQADMSNRRIAEILRTATGVRLDDSPSRWQAWWYDFNEVERPKKKPVATSYVRTMLTPPVSKVQYHSCFVAGTPVTTATGMAAIETIKPGDCVLAQHPDTGELAYKPVVAVTVRRPSPLIEIQVGSDTIRSTRGHPFWVDGVGWLMAKQLRVGQYVHTVDGPRLIDQVTESGSATCYNLVVADFATYFVGETKILVHDNNLRQVTTATVPGLIAE